MTNETSEQTAGGVIGRHAERAAQAEAEALRERDKELTARDEARCLRDAAARAKAERKSG